MQGSMIRDMEKTFTLSDEVIARVAQSLQECMLLGVDIVDIIRQIRLVESAGGEFVLSSDYKAQVVAGHKKLLAEADELKKLATSTTLFKS